MKTRPALILALAACLVWIAVLSWQYSSFREEMADTYRPSEKFVSTIERLRTEDRSFDGPHVAEILVRIEEGNRELALLAHELMRNFFGTAVLGFGTVALAIGACLVQARRGAK